MLRIFVEFLFVINIYFFNQRLFHDVRPKALSLVNQRLLQDVRFLTLNNLNSSLEQVPLHSGVVNISSIFNYHITHIAKVGKFDSSMRWLSNFCIKMSYFHDVIVKITPNSFCGLCGIMKYLTIRKIKIEKLYIGIYRNLPKFYREVD